MIQKRAALLFPLVQLPKKFKETPTYGSVAKESFVSISSTSEEVQRLVLLQ